MTSKIDRLVCNKLKMKHPISKSKVCAQNIFFLSNNDIKIVLSKYSSLSLEEKEKVKQFSNDLKLNHHNRFQNLSKFFKQAFNSDKPVSNNNEATLSKNVCITDKSNSKDVKATIPTSIKPEQKLVKNVLPTKNNSVSSHVKQDSTKPPFHTNIGRTSCSNNILINPLYSTIFPKIHQKVINQCFSSKVITNPAINNITTALNITQNLNPTCAPVSSQTNTSQQKFIENLPSKSQVSGEKIEKLETKKRDSDLVKRDEAKYFNNYKNTNKIEIIQFGEEHPRGSKNYNENQLKYNNNNKEVSKNTNAQTQIEPDNPNEAEVVQDLESFTFDHMKKIESLAQRNAPKKTIKINLSSNSQLRFSGTNNKINQNTESQVNNKYCYDTATHFNNTKHNKTTEPEIKIEHSMDNSIDDQRNVKSKLLVNDSGKEKSRSHSNEYHQKNAPSKSDFLDECNRLKSMLSKNAYVAVNVPKVPKKDQMKVIVTRRAKNKRNKNHYRKEESSNLKLVQISYQPVPNETVDLEEKPQIISPEMEPITSGNNLIEENIEQVDIQKKKPQSREVKVVNRVLRNDSSNDQIIKSISEKPFTEGCNKVTNDTVLVTNQDVKGKLDKIMDTEDLMVLLKYFYKLDGVEQRRLIEFLKELELTEPERVADLRKHVRTSPPEDEDKSQIPGLAANPVELDNRPESRNSDLSNIDLILEDIDSILNDEDDESNKKNENTEPPSKRLKTDINTEKLMKNDGKRDSTVSLKETTPVQYNNTMNFSFDYNDYDNTTSILYNGNNMQYQNYGHDYQNHYYQNNYQSNGGQFIQNETSSFQYQQYFNNYQTYHNFSFTYND